MNKWSKNLLPSLMVTVIAVAIVLVGRFEGPIVWALPLVMFAGSYPSNTLVGDRIWVKRSQSGDTPPPPP